MPRNRFSAILPLLVALALWTVHPLVHPGSLLEDVGNGHVPHSCCKPHSQSQSSVPKDNHDRNDTDGSHGCCELCRGTVGHDPHHLSPHAVVIWLRPPAASIPLPERHSTFSEADWVSALALRGPPAIWVN